MEVFNYLIIFAPIIIVAAGIFILKVLKDIKLGKFLIVFGCILLMAYLIGGYWFYSQLVGCEICK
jgi:high-affinity Fe2+/Pb2+ permease